MTRRHLPFAALLFIVALMTPAEARAGLLITHGDTIKHLGDVPAPMKKDLPQELGGAAVGFKYSYFGVFWLDLWTWDGGYCLFKDKRFAPLTAAQAALMLNKQESELESPFLYRFPLGLLILAGVVLLVMVGMIAELRSQKRTSLLLEDPKYQHAVALLLDHERKDEATRAARQASGALPAGPTEDEARLNAFEAAVAYLINEGVPREEAVANLRKVLAATTEGTAPPEEEA